MEKQPSLFDMFDGLMVEYIPLKFKMEDQKEWTPWKIPFWKSQVIFKLHLVEFFEGNWLITMVSHFWFEIGLFK